MDHREMRVLLLAIRWDPHANANPPHSTTNSIHLTYAINRAIFIFLSAAQFEGLPIKPEVCEAFFLFHIAAFRSLLTALELVLSLRGETSCHTSLTLSSLYINSICAVSPEPQDGYTIDITYARIYVHAILLDRLSPKCDPT